MDLLPSGSLLSFQSPAPVQIEIFAQLRRFGIRRFLSASHSISNRAEPGQRLRPRRADQCRQFETSPAETRAGQLRPSANGAFADFDAVRHLKDWSAKSKKIFQSSGVVECFPGRM